MARPRRTIVPLDAEATGTRTEAEAEAEAPALAKLRAGAAKFGCADISTPSAGGAQVMLCVPEAEPVPSPALERTPARQKLADAIAEVQAIEAEIAEAGAAVSEAERAKWTAASALDDAEAELERAKPRPLGSTFKSREPHSFRSQEDADAYHARLNEPPPSIEDAKAAVQRATDARDSAISTWQFHTERVKKATGRLSWKRSSIDDAFRLAVHYDPAMAALAAETKRLATAAAAARRAFEMAVGGMLMQPDHVFYGSTNPTDYRSDTQGWALLHRWREALDALRTDPDAPLPMPPTM